jgi:hypothetical protein
MAMLVIFGYSLFGRVDRVPGLFHVVTQFLHVYWMPILPKRSFLILETSQSAGHAIPLPLNWKSVLFAWGRLFLLLGGCAFLPCGIGLTLPDLPEKWRRVVALAMLSLPVVSLSLIGVSYLLTRAKAPRAIELAVVAGIPPEEVARRFVGKLRPEDEDRLRGTRDESMNLSNDSSRG